MNKIIKELKELTHENIKEYLKEVKTSDLEENGAIYYMNGRNGTEFDWYVNDRISDFMVFYNDEKNLGALKLTLYKDGTILIYIYGDKGNKLIKEVKTKSKASAKEILDLAIILKLEADDKKIFDKDIDIINTKIKIGSNEITDFENDKNYYEAARNRKKIFNLGAYVSKKITKEGWKVGYMFKDKALNEWDSGWQFLAGNEDDKYLESPENIELLSIASICQIDSDILKYLDNPIGTHLIRISSNEFEIDKNNKEIYMEKR